MNTAIQEVQNFRVYRFDKAFPKIARRETWLTMYLQLRDDGDSHCEAIATVRGEMRMAEQLREVAP